SQYTIDARRVQIDDANHKLRLLSPAARIRNERQRLDELNSRLEQALNNRLGMWRQNLQAQNRALNLASPQNLLARGYAIVNRALDGKRIVDVLDAAPGTSISVQLSKGKLTATVKDRQLDDRQDK